MTTINKVNTKNLSAAEMQEIFSAYKVMVDKYGFLMRHRNPEEYKIDFLVNFEGGEDELYLIKNEMEICGILTFEGGYDWAGNMRHELTIKLTQMAVPQSLTECLRNFIDEKLIQHFQIAIIAYNGELDKLVHEYSYKTQLTGGVYLLPKANIDVDLLVEASAKFQEQNSDLRVKYTTVVPEELIEPFCDLFNELQEDMPDVGNDGFVQYVESPEKLRKRMESFVKGNRTHHCYMIFNTKNEMVAMTNVSVSNNDPRFPYQFLIGVTKQYRGKGLGRWLYALMYRKLYENVNFEAVHVNHHPQNTHAINISRWTGYEHAYNETTYIINK